MKKNSIILMAFLILGGTYLLQERSLPKPDVTGGYSKLLNHFFSESQVHAIKFYRRVDPEKGIHLVRQNNKQIWKVASRFNALASNKSIDTLLQGLLDMEGEIRTADTSLFSDFELGENQGYSLVLFDLNGTELLHLLIGKKAATYTYGFVRFKDQNEIYVVDKEYRYLFGIYEDAKNRNPDHAKWLNRNVLSLRSEIISSITLTEEGGKIILNRKTGKQSPSSSDQNNKLHSITPEDTWVLQSVDKKLIVPQEQASALISYISAFTFNDIVSNKNSAVYGLQKPKAILQIQTKKGDIHKILLGSNSGTRYYVKKEKNSMVYEVENYVIKNTFDYIKRIEAM